MEAINAVKEEAQQNCDRISALEASKGKVPPWIWSLIVSLVVVICGGAWVQGQFKGSFDEFRIYVTQRLDRVEQRQYEERYRSPNGYSSPPVGTGERPR